MIRRRKTAQEVFTAAQMAVKDFWGLRSNGSDEALDLLEGVLTGHKLSASQLDRLRMKLPSC